MQEGGYHLKGISSKKLESLPVISVITVVYNSEHYIERTLQSVQGQTYQNIEHVIIDGASKDNTIQIIRAQESKIAYWRSSPDKGIYDAMNIGLAHANGDYVLFLNSGDEFHNSEVLQNIFTKFPKSDVYYGDTLITDLKGNDLRARRLRPPVQLNWESMQLGMVVCHQSLIVKKEIAAKYDIRYRISADIDWIIRSLKKAQMVINTEQYISKFMEGGMSQVNKKLGLTERFEILNHHFGLIKNLYNHFLIAMRLVYTSLFRK